MPVFSQKRLRLVNYLITACIVMAALLLIRDVINISLSKKKLRTEIADHENAKNVQQARKDFMSYASILQKNPFGKPGQLRPIAAEKKSHNGIHATPGNLLLVGTVVGPDEVSFAIFEDKTRRSPFKQEVVRFGDPVLNYGVLTKIDPASVEVTHRSIVYTLPIVEMKGRPQNFTAISRRPNSAIAKKLGETEYLLNREKVQHALDNPEKLLTDARLLPNFSNGNQEGFKMLEVKRGGIYESLGLKNGDILLRVNELEISNPEVAIQAMTALRGMEEVNLDIIRNGDNLSMTYQIR